MTRRQAAVAYFRRVAGRGEALPTGPTDNEIMESVIRTEIDSGPMKTKSLESRYLRVKLRKVLRGRTILEFIAFTGLSPVELNLLSIKEIKRRVLLAEARAKDEIQEPRGPSVPGEAPSVMRFVMVG